MTVLIPTVTALPPAPLVTDSEPVFASKASAFVNSLAQFRTELNELGSTVQDAVAGNLVQFDGFAGVWSAGTFNAGQVVFHTPSNAFYIALEDGETTEPPGGDWRQLGTAESTSYDNTTSGLAANDVQAAIDEVAAQEPEIASTAQAEAGTDNETFITPLRMREGFNASGSAPVFACRAWVNFDGTGTVAIRASGNVSSVTRNAEGDYTVNFTTAMPDANYSAGGAIRTSGGRALVISHTTVLTTSYRFAALLGATSQEKTLDSTIITVQIFR